MYYLIEQYDYGILYRGERMHKSLLTCKNVVFDIGNVLLAFHPEKLLQRVLPDVSPKAYLDALFRSHIWEQLDKGELSVEGAAHLASQMLDQHNNIKRLLLEFPLHMDVLPASSAINEIKAMGKKVFLLSNFHFEAFETAWASYDFLRAADGFVISSHVKLLKPDKRIYLHLLDKFSISAIDTLFIDDTMENVDSARNLGFHTIHFCNKEKIL